MAMPIWVSKRWQLPTRRMSLRSGNRLRKTELMMNSWAFCIDAIRQSQRASGKSKRAKPLTMTPPEASGRSYSGKSQVDIAAKSRHSTKLFLGHCLCTSNKKSNACECRNRRRRRRLRSQSSPPKNRIKDKSQHVEGSKDLWILF